jgi:hypothetical protein
MLDDVVSIYSCVWVAESEMLTRLGIMRDV